MSRYLITFDMTTDCLKKKYHVNSYNNAYKNIGDILSKHGFNNIQGSVYLGEEGISEAHGTLAIQELTATYDWFYSCVSNIKFYRIESDLNAQFIVDNVFQAKQEFFQRIEQLRSSLREIGLSESKINEVINKQEFKLDNAPIKRLE